MTDANPCPNLRCKSTDLEIQTTETPSGTFNEHRVRCMKCGVTGPSGKFPGQAKAAWNDLPREPEMGPKTVEMTRRLVGLLGDVIADKTGYASVYLVCGDGPRASVEFLTCVADAWDVVHENEAAKNLESK